MSKYKEVVDALQAAMGGRHEFNDYCGVVDDVLALDTVLYGRADKAAFKTEHFGDAQFRLSIRG